MSWRSYGREDDRYLSAILVKVFTGSTLGRWIHDEMSRAESWYGIVDGVYSWRAILRLQELEPEVWSSFKWSVQVLNTSPSIERLYQMKRSYEENRKSDNLIFVSLFDEYERILREYKRLKKVNDKESSAPLAAKAYDGGDHTSADTVTQKVRTALHLGEEVVKTLGIF